MGKTKQFEYFMKALSCFFRLERNKSQFKTSKDLCYFEKTKQLRHDMDNKYLNFLSQTRQAQESTTIQTLDPVCKILLEEIALACVSGQTLIISQAIGMTQIAAPSTLHRKLQTLLQVELVKVIFKDNNRRTKYLDLSPQGRAYFKRLSDLMVGIQSRH